MCDGFGCGQLLMHLQSQTEEISVLIAGCLVTSVSHRFSSVPRSSAPERTVSAGCRRGYTRPSPNYRTANLMCSRPTTPPSMPTRARERPSAATMSPWVATPAFRRCLRVGATRRHRLGALLRSFARMWDSLPWRECCPSVWAGLMGSFCTVSRPGGRCERGIGGACAG